jgi:hypothetical protein
VLNIRTTTLLSSLSPQPEALANLQDNSSQNIACVVVRHRRGERGVRAVLTPRLESALSDRSERCPPAGFDFAISEEPADALSPLATSARVSVLPRPSCARLFASTCAHRTAGSRVHVVISR